MIRIDEIYNQIFVPAVKGLGAEHGAHWFDPPGSTAFADLCNRPRVSIPTAQRYLFWDQEPVDPDRFNRFMSQFQAAYTGHHHVITSEYRSKPVETVSAQWGLQSHYYWFHGWAALDWYRGYDRARLIRPADQRRIEQTFVAPNRIIGGARQHRLHVLYWIFRAGLEQNNWVSCPAVCPAEMTTMADLIEPLSGTYPDIVTVFDRVALPLDMPGESGHPMTSCWLDLWSQIETSLVYVVTETVADGDRQHLTEKIFKPICQQIPFVVVGTAGALAYLRGYGFRTFGDLWDESYDNEPDMVKRIARIGALLTDLNGLSCSERQDLYEQAIPVVRHNYEHFYSGAFEHILSAELDAMLAEF